MFEVDLGAPDAEPDDLFGAGLASMDPPATQAELADLIDVMSEMSADEMAAWADAELAELEAEGQADTALGGWLDGMNDRQFANVREEAALYGGREMGFLDFAQNIDRMLATQAERERDRQAEDRAGQGRRRPTAEIRLSNALGRIGRGTFLYGQQPVTDLANDPGADALLDGGGGGHGLGPAGIYDEMTYQLTGQHIIPAGQRGPRRQPMPRVDRLAAKIGVK
jgi:hypothetical protein